MRTTIYIETPYWRELIIKWALRAKTKSQVEKVVLVALANNCFQDGNISFVSEDIYKQTGLTEWAFFKVITLLIVDGHIKAHPQYPSKELFFLNLPEQVKRFAKSG
ncbi:MAG: hypothetical protein COC10_07155 [Sphingobium sp.]|nr:MAG: hypothetical protein COC10_07155 [Sphingobium sp.]